MKPSVAALLLAAVVTAAFISAATGADVLLVLSYSSKSHKNVFWPLAKALAARGHNVTIESPFKKYETIPGITEYNPPELVNHTNDIVSSGFLQERGVGIVNVLRLIVDVSDVVGDSCDILLRSSQALRHKPNYDIVFMDEFFCDCGLAIAHVHNATPAYISTPGIVYTVTSRSGNPSFLNVNPHIGMTLGYPMSLVDRLVNQFAILFSSTVRSRIAFPKINDAIQRHLPGVPPVEELEREVGLTLVNNQISLAMPKPHPLLPNIVLVGGMHCEPAKPLPPNLATFVDGSGEEGFILISFGTNVQTTVFSEEKRKAFAAAFAQLKQRVVWKWHDENMPDVSPNVKVSKWLPQQDLLGHPRIRLFITHGGLLSQQETVYHGVPIITVPFFADQEGNADFAQNDGYGLKLQLADITTERILHLVHRILNEKQFKEAAQKVSQLMRDQPETPLERAVFWTEYVIRHKGAHHLRSPARHMTFYEYYMIDIAAVVATFLTAVVLIIYLTVRCLCACLCSSKKSSQKRKRQ